MIGGKILALFRDTYNRWVEDKAPRFGAALAYYSVFSLAPLLVVVTAVAGAVFGREAVQGRISSQLQGVFGPAAAEAIEGMVAGAAKIDGGIVATIVGTCILLFGASGVFIELHSTINYIWRVPEEKSSGILSVLRDRWISLGMVLGVGFLLLISLMVSAALAALTEILPAVPDALVIVAPVLNFLFSFAIISVLFALIFKYLPKARVRWHAALVGGCVTALLFTIGKSLLGLYIGTAGISTAYGLAGSILVVLIWIYYSAQIFLFGAEYTVLLGERLDQRGRKKRDAVKASRT